MAIKNTSLGGVDWVSPARIKPTDLNDTFDAAADRLDAIDNELDGTTHNISVISPIGSVIAWVKTFSTISSGTATTDTENKLVDSGATFISDGVISGMIVQNTTDDTFAIVDSVDSETTITLRADTQSGSSATDIFPDGTDAYSIFATPELPESWVECNGQTLSDSDSVYNGATIPDINNSAQSFLRGANSSGDTGGSEDHNHQWMNDGGSSNYTPASVSGRSASSYNSSGTSTGFTNESGSIDSSYYTNNTSTLPTYYEVVWIMRVK